MYLLFHFVSNIDALAPSSTARSPERSVLAPSHSACPALFDLKLQIVFPFPNSDCLGKFEALAVS